MPPRNLLASEPRFAQMLNSYNMCKRLNCLPESGGLLDQSADWVWYVAAIGNAEVKYQEMQLKEV